MAILVLDSGVGGLTVLRDLRAVMPTKQIIYVGDDGGFPYGEWPEEALVERLVRVFEHYLTLHDVELGIVACNTASTLIMPSLRRAFDIPFVGTVPAIKPAAERTVSGLVSVIATPGTINRRYTQQLVQDHAAHVTVNLVACTGLAPLAEHYMHYREIDTAKLWQEIEPCFVESNGHRTDIVVLGCTHYPFLVNEMRKLAPWPVDWIDPSEAIAMRAFDVLSSSAMHDSVHDSQEDADEHSKQDLVYLTSNQPTPAARRLMRGFGLQLQPDPHLVVL